MSEAAKTYNGVKFFGKVTGLPEAEISWMWCRLKELKAAGYTSEVAKEMMSVEAVKKPWLSTTF